jgi:membrane-anchored protein YejM (alkaline phosphatase superfamily)
MQSEMPQIFDFAKETDATLKMYGLQRGQDTGFGWQCLVARRMVERGVRFVELIDTGTTHNWDVHGEINDMNRLAKNVDQSIAGLLKDLKSRGMLEDTLVVWTTEFGRTPWSATHGREHYNKVYSSWVAGGGFKSGMVYGKSDEYGIEVAENPVHVHDFHATLLHCLGFDHTKLTYRHGGRDFRLTDLYGEVIRDVLV